MAFYEPVKTDQGYYIQALSPCWNPIICFGDGPYKRKDTAEKMACSFSGILPNFTYDEADGEPKAINGLQLYRRELAKYKMQHNMT